MDKTLFRWLADTAELLQLFCPNWELIDTEQLMECQSREEALDYISEVVKEGNENAEQV